MNRLIIVGNGFDLAHGLKTSYKDFILWYLKKVYTNASFSREFHDGLMSIIKEEYYFGLPGENNIVEDLVEFFYESNLTSFLNDQIIKNPATNSDVRNPFKTSIKSDFFRRLLTCCSNSSWVDIEIEFYKVLKNILHNQTGEKEQLLLDLNRSLSHIITYLEEYLQTQKPTHLNPGYSSIFSCLIKKDDIVIPCSISQDRSPTDSLILNFNYTNTPSYYFKSNNYNLAPAQININYVHGKLGSKTNPIIFGFGDELDDDYQKMEQQTTKGFFEYIKSFWYFKSSNYHNLIRFITGDVFQVFILGHSCGLSDRTMLNMIFEHENCKSIKIYYYQNEFGYNNYTDLTQEIARHFKNKVQMREKIVPFDKSEAMPQV